MSNQEIQKEEKKLEFKDLVRKAKKADGRKVAKIALIVCALGMIILMTITQVGFTEKFDFLQWFANAMVLTGIMIFGLFIGESLGRDKQVERVDGLYQKNLKKYNIKLEEIRSMLGFFAQWFAWHKPQELFEKKLNFLVGHGIDFNQAILIVKYCYAKDIDELKQHPIKKKDEKTGKDVFIRKIEDYQVDMVKYVLTECKLDADSASFYQSAFAKSTNRTLSEKGKAVDKDISYVRKTSRALKISLSLIVSIAITSLTVKDMMGGDNAQAWMNLVSRITSLFTSMWSGYITAITIVKLEAEKFDIKEQMLTIFKNDFESKRFVPMDDEFVAKREYEQYEKDLEEAKKNVIDPEILNQDQVKRVGINTKSIPYSGGKK